MATAKKAVFLVGCGCFNPPTIMHQRMFEIGRDHLESLKSPPHRVLGGIISPTHDSYAKPGLLPSRHRNAMVRLAVRSHPFVKVSSWETEREEWTRTALVLNEHQNMVDAYATGKTQQRPDWMPEHVDKKDLTNVGFYLLCGDDLLESFNTPGLWKQEDIQTIVRDFGLVVLSRGSSKSQELVYKSDILNKFKDNIHFALSDMGTDISSTKVRLAVRRAKSVRFLVSDDVIEYIKENKLYAENEYSACQSLQNGVSHISIVDKPSVDDNLVREIPSVSTLKHNFLHNNNNNSDHVELSYLSRKNRSHSKERRIRYAPGTGSHAAEALPPPPPMTTSGLDLTSGGGLPLIDDVVSAGHHRGATVSTTTAVGVGTNDESSDVSQLHSEESEDRRTNSCSDPSVQIEFTTRGVKIISDKESFL